MATLSDSDIDIDAVCVCVCVCVSDGFAAAEDGRYDDHARC